MRPMVPAPTCLDVHVAVYMYAATSTCTYIYNANDKCHVNFIMHSVCNLPRRINFIQFLIYSNIQGESET